MTILTLARRVGAGALVAWSALALVPAQAQDAPIPPLTARVTDAAGMLTAEQRAALETQLANYERTKGTQIAILTVSTTAPEVIEQYGIRVAEAWKIGRKGTADGVIVIVAKDNPRDLRRLRIEVGKGLEGAIPDAYSKRIIDEAIAPRFRNGDFYGGLLAGVERIEALLQGEALPPPPEARPSARDLNNGTPFWLPAIFILFVVSLFMRRGSRQMGYVAGNRALNRSIGPFVAGAVLGALSNRGGGGGGGFGGFGGGGGGGGGFSGGGGDFGGGGASGDW